MPGVGKGWTQTALTLGSLRMKANEDCMEVATPDGGSPMVPVTPTEEEERQARVRTRRALFQDGQEPTVESLSEQLHDVIAHCQQVCVCVYLCWVGRWMGGRAPLMYTHTTNTTFSCRRPCTPARTRKS